MLRWCGWLDMTGPTSCCPRPGGPQKHVPKCQSGTTGEMCICARYSCSLADYVVPYCTLSRLLSVLWVIFYTLCLTYTPRNILSLVSFIDGGRSNIIFSMELSIELNRTFFCCWCRFVICHFTILQSLLIFCHIFIISSGLVAASWTTSCMTEWETNTELFTLTNLNSAKCTLRSAFFKTLLQRQMNQTQTPK